MASGRKPYYINDSGKYASDGRTTGYEIPIGQRLDSSGDYTSIDYEALNKGKTRQEHVYRGLNTVTSGQNTGTTQGKQPQLPEVVQQKTRVPRALYVVIALLVALLVAVVAAFVVFYVTSNQDSDSSKDFQRSGSGTTTTITSPSTTPTPLASTTTGFSIAERCQDFDGLIPHPDECQAYYNCSHDVPLPTLTNFERFLMECPYPQLFDAETLTCKNFEKVTCGDREEAKDGCDYRAIRCSRQPCMACDVRYPKCKGKNDGVNVHEIKPWSPYYIICYKERYVTEMYCPSDDRLAGSTVQLFSPDYMACVTLDRIPREHGGVMPNCTGKADGRHPMVGYTCNLYAVCQWEHHILTVKCGEGTKFDETTKECTVSANTCLCDGNGCAS